ncbi:stage V sporulation protein D [Fonticella tunisiensis]|uniref:Stage V sporulation protein D (Sporulation-specific penicillin-binding protein) n=1 Tax=Fonticella tunisiensis TaxID=1096341 RepID=A0A4R7KR96_9CLOT|nr:stage V sporulation protein D [Fonticella tunisiensis]TDT61863.1 stage V sporulation protein D (sporulation-specific penicillin-binding protein) [Fonticella tunisiensis]
MNFQHKTTITVKRRIVVLLLIIFVVQMVIVGRYAWVQIVWSPELQKLAVEQWTQDIKISAKRGKILDRNGDPLALSGNVERVEAFTKSINEAEKNGKITKEEMAEKIAPILGVTKDEVLNKLNKTLPSGLPMSTITLARRIEKEQGNKIRDLNLPGILVSEDTKRYYPNGNLASHILGSTDIDGKGRAGLERYYDKYLAGVPGRFRGETDPYHRELPYTISDYEAPKNGSDIVLTIDETIQFFVEKALEKGLAEYKAKRASAIVMDPKTGEILAMANKPDYDPNNPVVGTVEESTALWRNRMINESFEPGSVLKVITAAAAIEENEVKDSDKFFCSGSYKVADRTIHCWKRTGHGLQTFPEILQNSCNVGFMMLGERLGKEKLYKYFNSFGLGQKTGIDYPAEEKGILMSIDKVGPVELATQAFGQGISVTGIQYATVLATIANDGKMVQPHLVKKIINTDENGNTSVVKEFTPQIVKQVISAETARHMREILESVVSEGGAKKAYIEGYHIAGKTGTAQKVVDGRYAQGKYISSFGSMVPASDPKLVLFVSIDEPDPSNYYSGSTAAPLAKSIYEDLFKYLNMEPDTSGQEQKHVNKVVLPELRGMGIKEAESTLKNIRLNYETDGNGSIVYDMSPKPGVSVDENSKVVLYLGNSKNDNTKVVVPDFTEMTRKEISELAASLGLKVSFNGDGIGVSQDVEPGTEVDKNTTVKIILEQPDE